MHFQWQTETARSIKYTLALFDSKADGVAENVDRIDKAFFMQLRKHGVAHQFDVIVGAADKFGRQRVRAQERCLNCGWIYVAEPTRDAQHLALGVQIEPVARLDFDGCDAFRQQRLQSPG